MLRLSEENPILSVSRMSLNDELTQLYNREGFICTAEHLLGTADEDERWACLLSLQVNHLDVIDQVLGSEAADRFLILTGICLRDVFRHSAVIGRISPTRFAVLMLVQSPAACSSALQRFIETIDRRNSRRREIDLSLVGGYNQFDAGWPVSVSHLLSEADRRLEAARNFSRES